MKGSSSYRSNAVQANPDLPVLIREAQGTPPRAFARFGKANLSYRSELSKLMGTTAWDFCRPRSREAS